MQGSSIPVGSGDVLQSKRAGFWCFERFFVVFVLLYFAGGLNFFFQQGEQTAQDPPSSSQRLLMAQPRASNAADAGSGTRFGVARPNAWLSVSNASPLLA